MPKPERRTKGSDTELFSQFVAARSNALHRTAFLLVGDRGLAQDVLQEALTKTWAAWGRIREPAKAEAYCRRVLTHTAISWYRRKSWAGERPSEELPELSSGSHEHHVTESDQLRRALQSLPPRQRAAVVCRFYDDLSEAETARVMGCAIGTVKSQVNAGLKRLRTLLPEASLAPPVPPTSVSSLLPVHPVPAPTAPAPAQYQEIQ